MSPYTRTVPRARTRIGEIDLECICGDWISYPEREGDDDSFPSVCPSCLAEWYVVEPLSVKKARR